MKEEMQKVFDEAILKAEYRKTKPGNTSTPWDDFKLDHLRSRLWDEFHEYIESGGRQELLDIINIAAFMYIRHTKIIEDDLPEWFGADPVSHRGVSP